MKKILIFGATSAIAQATARITARARSAFFLVGRDSAKIQALAEDLKVRGAAQVATAIADLKDVSLHADLIQQADESLGGIDTVFIAHGMLGNQTAVQQNVGATLESLQTNLISGVSILTLVANRFEQARAGTIVVLSSVAGERGRQSNYVYGTAKGGLSIFLQGLRNRLQTADVRVITIKLGFVDTPMTREFEKGWLWASPETAARAIVRAVKNRKDVSYVPWFWFWIMIGVRLIPERFFKRLKL